MHSLASEHTADPAGGDVWFPTDKGQTMGGSLEIAFQADFAFGEMAQPPGKALRVRIQMSRPLKPDICLSKAASRIMQTTLPPRQAPAPALSRAEMQDQQKAAREIKWRNILQIKRSGD